MKRPVDYEYICADASHTADYLWPAVLKVLRGYPVGTRVFDLGCGNGAFARFLDEREYSVRGVDPSASAIEIARRAHSHLDLHQASAYDDLAERFGQFPAVVSLEVVEHVYAPRTYAATLFDLVEPGGIAVVSTPYHGYVKNLVLALTGKLDDHFTALWDHGHIKFWSVRTLRILLEEAGFREIDLRRVGRIPQLAKSMIAVARKPR